MALPEPSAPLTWVTYIGVPNLDETLRQAESLGGKIVKKPEDIPTIGRFALVQDPQGAMFAAFTPLPRSGSTAMPDAPPGVGDFSWHELATTDWRSGFNFYKSLFGWEETDSMDMGPMGTYQMYGWKGGQMLGGMFNKAKEQPGPPAWLPYIKVPDAKKAAATAKQLGAQIINGPMEVPGGSWIAAGIDPQGAMFAVHSAKPAEKTAKPVKGKSARPAASKGAGRTRAGAKKRSAPRTMKKKPAAKRRRPRKQGRSKKRAGSKK
jgi:predicted enzyme related to lactoylglutathione lyase